MKKALLLLALAALTACNDNAGGGTASQQTAPTAASSSEPLQVVTTVNLLTDLVEQLGGERVQVSGLMGAGVDPHLYNATAGDIGRLQSAKLVMYGGLHLEGKMNEALEGLNTNGNRAVALFETLDKSKLLTDEEGATDPHVWFDISLWKDVATAASAALQAADPDGKDFYQNRLQDYLSELDELQSWSKNELARVPAARRVLVTAHDAFNYWARANDFEVMAVQGISTAAEASASNIRDLAKTMSERQIPALFVESTVSDRTLLAVQAAAAERNWPVQKGGELYSDALGEKGTPEGTYAGMIRHNTSTIAEALQ